MEVNKDSSTQNPENSAVLLRNIIPFSWRPSCIVNTANDIMRNIHGSNPVLESKPTVNNKNAPEVPLVPPAVGPSNNEKLNRRESTKSIKDKTQRNIIVNIVLVEAKGLPDVPDDGLSHGVYCKFRLGSHTCKSKSVLTTRYPQWKERFKLNGDSDQLLHISLWDKGKHKNFMGSCVLDLSNLEKERTHDIWQQLDENYGSLHLSITICILKQLESTSNPEYKVDDLRSKFAFYNVSTDLNLVGQLHVRVYGARGLKGKPSAYCTLELENEKIHTPKASYSAEPVWDKSYVFNIYDVTSTLEVKVLDSSINSLLNDFLGRVTIPLLRIKDGEMRWYALKDNNKRKGARGNCPRVRLELSLVWNPVTASLKLFRPKQVKYIAKEPKFDLALVYKNVKFIRDTFEFLYVINEYFKHLFEWEDREFSAAALIIWLIFWYYFEPWMGPLLTLALFPVVYIYDQEKCWDFTKTLATEEVVDTGTIDDLQNGDTITDKVKGLPEMTLTITHGIEYMVSVAERLYNLAAFKVPFLSFLAMVLLIFGSVILYILPFKYLMISLGLYKFFRKRINPQRVLNNDLLDFISRIPDHKMLKDWKELSVPEPQQPRISGSFGIKPTIPNAS
ncbi:unnamed protein product [Arctia plantaginis]|uniref:C2 domain-containing protein n=1 Tax=Arctia plantaginis TaxID=874455 RepID=A0A8S1AKW5_ARCPL|nr:unnamed protein product [Arctia plantaginis]